MRITSLSKSILATGWLVIALSIMGMSMLSSARIGSVAGNIIGVQSQQLITAMIPSSKSSVSVADKTQVTCMAKNLYYEAGNESLVGKMAVGHVVLNRLSTANTLTTVCGIIYEKSKDHAVCQFSWVCQHDLPGINTDSKAWRESYQLANTLLQLNTREGDLTSGATHYHNTTVHPPWAKTLRKIVQIDEHIFYR